MGLSLEEAGQRRGRFIYHTVCRIGEQRESCLSRSARSAYAADNDYNDCEECGSGAAGRGGETAHFSERDCGALKT